jgi:hypothetical protein
VRVRIDEARCDDQSGRIDGTADREARGLRVADERDAVTCDADIGRARGTSGSVDDRAVADEDVHAHLRLGGDGSDDRDEQSEAAGL